MSRIVRFGVVLILSLFLGGSVVGGQEPNLPSDTTPDEPGLLPDHAAPLADPVPIVVERHTGFAYGGGLLYWEADCAYQADPSPVYIRRQPETGGAIQTLYEVGSPTVDQCSSVSPYNVADDDGFFYANVAENRLDARLSHDPATVIPLITGLDMAQPILTTDNDYVYVTASGGIYRAAKDSPGATKINHATGVNGLVVDETHIYWVDATGLWRADKTCITPVCWNDKEQVSEAGGYKHLNWTEEGDLLWVRQRDSGWSVMEYDSSLGYASSLYYSSFENTWNIGRPVYHDGCYYWLEDRDPSGPLNGFLRRKCGGTVDSIAVGLSARDMLAVGPLGVVFSDEVDDAIYRLDFDAEAITKDFFLDAMEVTQGIQNLYNTVDLVAKKTTYVRVFGGLLADRGADAVQVTLRGNPDAAELPGSPLYPVGNPRSLGPLADWDRADIDESWLFQLPQSWIQEGSLTLRAEVDPHGVYGDPNPGDNVLETAVTFQRKAPICYVFVPIRTEAGHGSESNPTFGQMVDLAERLLPVPDLRVHYQSGVVEELEVCWGWGFIPYACWGPYEMWQDSLWGDWASDGSKAITSLATRYTFSDLDCDGGRVQFVGMVHEDSRTDGSEGLGRYDSHASWIKLTQPGTAWAATHPWTWPRSGSTLVHESGHNIERYHVDCGQPGDLDDDYPYTDGNGEKCVLDDGDPGSYGTHFGFDVNTLQPIRPDTPNISDLMSYASYRWLSDYTWEAFFDELPVGPASAQSTSSQPAPVAAAEQVDLATAEAVVLIGGHVAPSLNEGRLNYAWVYPTDSVSSQVLGKLQALAAPAGDASPAAPVTQYLLRLRDANGAVVADYPFVPQLAADDPSPDEQAGFLLSFPAPAVPVAQIDLLIWGTAVDSLTPGASMPTVEILQPAGGETFVDQMTIVWRATDADVDDQKLFTVQYSPDLGQTWLAIVNDFPGLFGTDVMTLTLDSLLGVPASTTGGLVRVAASDGYNTAMATSNPFVVANQPPQPYIVSPMADQLFEAGDVVLLRGGASDTEDGSLSGASLSWDVTGQATVTGEEVFPAGLAPGDYEVTLTAEDSEGATGTAQSALTVSPLGVPRVPSSNVPELDGFCDDEGYEDGVLLGLKPYPDGSQGAAHLVRSDDHLWVCFSGLKRGSTSEMDRPANSAGLLIDANHSQEHAVQADDTWVYVQEDGTPTVWTGPVWGGDATPNGLQTRVSANDNAWTAELRLDASLLGGWNHVVGLELLHVWVPGSGGSHHPWPYAANSAFPDSWATTALGKWPRLDSLSPNEAFESDIGTVVGVSGEGFESGAVALWNGAPRTTFSVSNSGLLFSVEAGDLAVDGSAEVRVQNPGLGAAPSNALTFLIKNPVPAITELTPNEATAGGGDLLIGISGQGFDDGAEALWNGQPKYTVVNNSTFLRFQIAAPDLATVRDVGVAVRNPEPGGGASNVISFTILAPPNQAPNAPSAPDPVHRESGVPTDQILTWQGSDPEGQPLRYDVAFGDSNPPPVVDSGLTVASYDPGGLQTDTAYYWQIIASDGQASTAGPIWYFSTASAPAPNRPPRIPSRPDPSDGLTDVPVDQVLGWAGGDPDGDAVEYSVALGTGTPPPVVATGVTRDSYRPPSPLSAGRTYYWQIVASDGRETTAGPIWSFTTLPSNRAPYAPARPSPADGERDVSLDPVLTWVGGDPDGDALTYSVALGTRAPLPVVATRLTSSSYRPDTLTAGTTYYWQIMASDGVSDTVGPVWSFATVPPNLPPHAPNKPDPADRETGVTTDQVLTWRASDPERDRLTYDVYFGTDSRPPLVAEGLMTPSYDPRSLGADTRYYWSITVSDGLHDTAGPTWSFRTAPANRAPDEPYAPSPADRAVGVPVDQVASWRCYDPDGDRLTYDVYFGTRNPPPLVSRGLTTALYDPGMLSRGTNYYWSISCSDGIDATAGPTWRFQTSALHDVYLPLVLRSP